jgi:anti-sigma factor RsiW
VTCREFADFIVDYLSGDLEPEPYASFQHHLTLCPNCQEYLAQYRATIEAGKDAFAEPDSNLPGDVPEELIQAILASRSR